MAEREQKTGTCDHCLKSFDYYLIHNGFNESWYAYCDQCGATAILNLYASKTSELWHGKMVQGLVPPEVEQHLRPCSCGGRFLATASPRCPHCAHALSPVAATSWIEKDAPGTKKGWHWQESWNGLYCIVIERHLVRDNFA
jgi:hypothetical protein